jgi:ATP phosphoribosyltransferase regulatory subunit
MELLDDVLGHDEKAIMRLRSLYKQFGYTQYKMSRFEEYELYAENKAFLASGDIITFTGAGGKLMALRPDVTLSIVKSIKNDGALKKLYYNGNVYRPEGFEFKEQMQVGLECIGEIDICLMSEVLMLAHRSLEELSECSRLDISHMGYISGLLKSRDTTAQQRTELLRRVSEKNVPELEKLCLKYGLGDDFCEMITALTALYGPYDKVAAELRRINVNEETDAAMRELGELYELLKSLGAEQNINLDFSIVNDISYYSGIIFQGFIEDRKSVV